MNSIKSTLSQYVDPATLSFSLQQMTGITKWIGYLMWLITFPMELTFRSTFGVRYVSTMQFYASLLFMLFLTAVSAVIDLGIDQFAGVTLTYIVIFHHRRYQAWSILRDGDYPTHTMSFGTSFINTFAPIIPRNLGFLLDDWTQYKYIEPLMILVLGLAVWFGEESRVVAVWLILGSLLTGLKAQLLYSAMIEKLLNQYDATLTRYVVPKLISGEKISPQERAGIPVNRSVQDIMGSINALNAPDVSATVYNAMSTEGEAPDD